MKSEKSSWLEFPIDTKPDSFVSVSRTAEPIAPDCEINAVAPSFGIPLK